MADRRQRGNDRGGFRGRGRGGGKSQGWTKFKKDKPDDARASNSAENNSSNNKNAKFWKSKGSGNNGGEKIRRRTRAEENEMDTLFGFEAYAGSDPRLGWLINMRTASEQDEESQASYSMVDYYFIQQDGGSFKATVKHEPYFYVAAKESVEIREVEAFLRRRFEKELSNIAVVQKEDMDMKNHLAGLVRYYIKLSFRNVQDLMNVRRILAPAIEKNKARESASAAYQGSERQVSNPMKKSSVDLIDHLIDIREFDVPYHMRVSIDKDVRVGLWYDIYSKEGMTRLDHRADILERPEPRVCAYDIETTKAPLKFPDAREDQIMMISYMIDKKGYLITNREIVSEDIEDFEYTPKPEYEGPFAVFNEADETALLKRFFEHLRQTKPAILVTFNGDFFDWPFVENRAKERGLCMMDEIGFYMDQQAQECRSRYASHMDAFYWVKRDSYLPQGSQGLKAVTKAKLGYQPLELDPEVMTKFAREQPQTLAAYSVSDAVATYYLYMKYVHPFILSLCTILPMSPDEVLRKGSGTLCEALLMVEAYKKHIICPNKHESDELKTYKNFLLESETYVGAQVEALESGVFRSDIPCRFKIGPDGVQQLIGAIDRDLHFALKTEGVQAEEVTNYDQVKESILEKLLALKDVGVCEEQPLIYHLDVAAMYPNIILTNRLQPHAIVDKATCAACDFNRPDSKCQRDMQWSWRGEYFLVTRTEYERIKNQLNSEMHHTKDPDQPTKEFRHLSPEEQKVLLDKRIKQYARKNHGQIHKTVEEERTATVCMRENPFYVDTVRAFTARRYEYKGKHKAWQKKLTEAIKDASAVRTTESQNMVVLFDSLQLAHKCILNSFYGYVMRKGARWYSMEMAGVVCHTGKHIITQARELIEQIGKPLELDTDGIWCMLPRSFPENFDILTTNPKKPKCSISYPCAMLNASIHQNFTNDQYQNLVDAAKMKYEIRKECTIYFEVDGPYRAMILPASKEEGKVIKKRYAVFHHDGSLAELKGFEMKRRGELKIIKVFQAQVFETFLQGCSLEECYGAVGGVANHWLDVLYTQGRDMEPEDVMEYLSESSTMSRSLDEYEGQKSSSITTARRLAEFLGDQVIKDKGLNCHYIVSQQPEGLPVTERAVPVAIFSAEPAVMKTWLRRWLKDPSLSDFDIRSLLDWSYYIGRLGSAIQKIITIPAAVQKVLNPVPRVAHPDWLFKKLREKNDRHKQTLISDMFSKAVPAEKGPVEDMEDIGRSEGPGVGGTPRVTKFNKRPREDGDETPSKRARTSEATPEKPASNNSSKAQAPQPVRWLLEDYPPGPDMDEDFPAWLAYSKKKWRRMKEERKRRRMIEGKNPKTSLDAWVSRMSNGPSPSAGVGGGHVNSFFKQHSQEVRMRPWEIIQIVESGTPGILVAWSMVGNMVYPLQVRVPRVVYVNSRVPADHLGKKVARHLPRNRPVYNLYEVVMDEEHFRRNQKEIAGWMGDPNIEGVYETQMSLLFKAVLAMGCMCTAAPLPGSSSKSKQPKQDKQNFFKGKSDVYDFEDLRQIPVNMCNPYLDKEGIRRVFVYHSSSEQRGCIYGVFTTGATQAQIFVANKNPRAERPHIMRTVQQELGANEGAGGRGWADDPSANTIPAADLTVDVQYLDTPEEAARSVNNILGGYIGSRNRGPTIVVVQSTVPLKKLQASMSALRDLPVMRMPANDSDAIYPPLQWQAFAARKLASRYLMVGSWYQSQLNMARYSNIPMGNLDTDAMTYMCDVFFARALRKKFVLWYSEDSKPDIGGSDLEDYSPYEETGASAEIKNPGAYRAACIEVDLVDLVLNAIVQASTINQAEGSETFLDSTIMDSNTTFNQAPSNASDGQNGVGPSLLTTLDDAQACGQAFIALKNIVVDWWGDWYKNKNRFAEVLLDNLYRWLRSPQSKMYEPVLHRLVHTMTRKMYMLLMAELKRLNATIIHANFNRVIICTNKLTLESAEAYLAFILETIHSKELFSNVGFSPTRRWESLLFMDQANFGGVSFKVHLNEEGKVVEGAEDEDEEDNDEDDDHLTPRESLRKQLRRRTQIEMSWEVASYLPVALHNPFNALITEFVYLPLEHRFYTSYGSATTPSPWRRRKRRREESGANDYVEEPVPRPPPPPTSEGSSSTQAPMSTQKPDKVEEEETFLKTLVSSKFSSKLLKMISDIQRTVSEDSMPIVDGKREPLFPRLPGSHLKLHSPALEFVKTVSYVLALDKVVGDEVAMMRKALMKQLGMREFAPEAQFVDPCLSFVLPEVVCEYCSACRDLDICRDPNLTPDEWRCASCEHLYNKDRIEIQLVDIANRRMSSYNMQDLKCRKCGMVKDDNMMDFCKCGGVYLCTVPVNDIGLSLQTFLRIGRYFHFMYLTQSVEWMLSGSGMATIT